MIVLSKNKQSLHAFNFFCHDWQVSSLTHISNYLKQHSSQWNSITKSTKLHDFVTKLSGFTFKQQISKIFHNTLPYSITFPNLNYPNCHIIAKKKTKKGSTLTSKWSRSNNVAVWPFFSQNWFFQTSTFSSLFYLFNFIFSEFYVTFL